MVDRALAAVEADDVVGGGEDDPPDALAARRLEDVVAADDVVLQDRLPGVLDRARAEVDDAVDAGAEPLDRRQIGEVGRDELLAGLGLDFDHVRQPERRVDPAQQRPDALADPAGGACDQDPVHASPPSPRCGPSLADAGESGYRQSARRGAGGAQRCGGAVPSGGVVSTFSSVPAARSRNARGSLLTDGLRHALAERAALLAPSFLSPTLAPRILAHGSTDAWY